MMAPRAAKMASLNKWRGLLLLFPPDPNVCGADTDVDVVGDGVVWPPLLA